MIRAAKAGPDAGRHLRRRRGRTRVHRSPPSPTDARSPPPPTATGTSQTLWFFLIVVLWIGYFVLEGFDFGVGMLLPFVGRDVRERGTLIRTIGPVWDGNEVWLLVAGGATFAAFPGWYATLFSGFYLALFLVLVGLIVRGVAIEYRNKRPDERWRAPLGHGSLAVSSAVPALLWGVAFADVVHGVPIDAQGDFTGNLLDLLDPYALFGGVTTLVALRLPRRALPRRCARPASSSAARATTAMRLALPASALVLGFLIWTWANAASAHDKGLVPGIVPHHRDLPAVRRRGAFVRAGQPGFAFTSTAVLDRADHAHALPQPLSARDRVEHEQRVQPDDLHDELVALHAHRHVDRRAAASRRSCCSTRPGRTGSSAPASETGTRPTCARRSSSSGARRWASSSNAELRATRRSSAAARGTGRPPLPRRAAVLGLVAAACIVTQAVVLGRIVAAVFLHRQKLSARHGRPCRARRSHRRARGDRVGARERRPGHVAAPSQRSCARSCSHICSLRGRAACRRCPPASSPPRRSAGSTRSTRTSRASCPSSCSRSSSRRRSSRGWCGTTSPPRS